MFCSQCSANNPDDSIYCLNCGQKVTKRSELLEPPDPSSTHQDFNQLADQLIATRRWSEAQSLLDKTIREMPYGWNPIREEADSLKIAFWDQEEFFAYVQFRKGQANKSILWTTGSYSKAWYQLAVIAIEQPHFDLGLKCVASGLEIEPGHPHLWCEKGFILNRLHRHQEALDCYRRAGTVRDWASMSQLARALRGEGASLIDLNRLGDAEAAFLRSLELETSNQVAQHELDYIRQLRNKRDTHSR
jgi:tetratricopeptide (TPR) repeat protein